MKTASLIALFASLAAPAFATVTMEFQLGGVQVPAGSVGVLVADTGANGFTSPFTSAGTTLDAGEKIGTDDTIVAVFDPSTLSDFTSGEGFSALISGIDYTALGLAQDQTLIFYVFPEQNAGGQLRDGEPHVAYTTTDTTPNSTMDFSLPRDGGSYLLAALGSEVGGNADLASVDISPFNHTATGNPLNRSLTQTAEHTYFFEVTSAGLLQIAGTGAAGLRAELYGPDGQLIAEADGNGNFAFEEDLELGFHTLVVFRNIGGPTNLPYSLEVTDESGVVIPDVSVGNLPSAPIGNDVFGGAGQLAGLVSAKARPVTGFARVGNDGDLAEILAVRGTPGNGFCKINFLAPGNVTSAMIAGTFRTPTLASADAPLSMRVQFLPNKKKLTKKRGKRKVTLRKTFTTTVRATPTVSTADADAATIRVQTR